MDNLTDEFDGHNAAGSGRSGSPQRLPRPVAPAVNPGNIPDDLKRRDHWLVWRYVWREGNNGKPGKWDKPPSNARTGGYADTTDPSTWSSFDEAMAAYQAGGWDGIGYVPLLDDNLVALDLDHCRSKETGEIAPWAATIVTEMDTYTELSPSQEGLRLFAYARKPDRARTKRGNVEIFDGATAAGKPGGRYVTVTGQHLTGTPADIQPRQEALASVYTRELKGSTSQASKNAPNGQAAATSNDQKRSSPKKTWTLPDGPLSDADIVDLAESGIDEKLTRLWNGDVTGHGSDHSTADAALVCKLLYWIGSPDGERADQLFRQSKLMRAKWDELHGDKTYGDRTIAFALQSQTDFRSPNDQGQKDSREHDTPVEGGQHDEGFRNFVQAKIGKKYVRRGLAVQQIEARLRKISGGWPRRINDLLFAEAPGPRPLWLERPPQLFAWIAGHLPGDGLRNQLVWAEAADMISQGGFHAYLCQTAEEYDAIELYPHSPLLPRTYYMHSTPTGGDGKALQQLIGRYSPATEVDRDLIRAFFLTLLWGGPPGARPAWLITGKHDDTQAGRGLGKSTLVKHAARVVGGHIDLALNERMTDVITRLLSPDALERRVVFLDNVKTLKFSWAELEALIKAEWDTISGQSRHDDHGEGGGRTR